MASTSRSSSSGARSSARPSRWAAAATARAIVRETWRDSDSGGSSGASGSRRAGDAIGQGPRRGHEHGVGDAACPRRRGRPGPARGRRSCCCTGRSGSGGRRSATSLERAAGRDQGAAVGPGDQVGRRRLGPRGRVREREDDRARSTCCAIARTTSSVNVPGWPEAPIRIVGRTCLTTSSRPIGCPSADAPGGDPVASAGRASAGTA